MQKVIRILKKNNNLKIKKKKSQIKLKNWKANLKKIPLKFGKKLKRLIVKMKLVQ